MRLHPFVVARCRVRPTVTGMKGVSWKRRLFHLFSAHGGEEFKFQSTISGVRFPQTQCVFRWEASEGYWSRCLQAPRPTVELAVTAGQKDLSTSH